MTTLLEYLRTDETDAYEYTGTIWGDVENPLMLRSEIIELLEALPDLDGLLNDTHPTYGIHPRDDDGSLIPYYYIEGDRIGWYNRIQEIVLAAVS